MDKKQRSALRRFRRVHEFLTANPVETTTVKLQALDEVIRQMAGNGEEQDAHDRKLRGETARQLALRLALRNQHMVPISRIARQVFSVPGMDVKFLLPRKLKDNQLILNAARGMAQAAEQHAAVFVQEGLPADFVERFRSAIEALASVLEVRVESQRRRQTSRQATRCTRPAKWSPPPAQSSAERAKQRMKRASQVTPGATERVHHANRRG